MTVFRMKRIFLLTTVISMYGILSFAPAAATLQSLQPGMEAPDFSLKTITGASKSFAELKGEKLTVLVFWSTWSEKSGKLLTRMQQLHEKYKDRGLSVIGVNVDEQRISAETMAEIKTLSEKLGLGFPLLIDHGLAAFHDFGVIAVPTTVIMGKDRKVVDTLSGYPLVGSEAMMDFIISTIEGKKYPVAESTSGYQPSKNAVRFYQMGMSTLRSKRMAETAEMWFKKAIDADPAFTLPHLSLGNLYRERGDTALAQSEFREVLAKEPGHPIALCELGLMLVNEGKGSEGSALLEAAQKKAESYAPCYYYAAYASAKEGKLEEAGTLIREAEKLNPHDYRSYLFQGRIYEERPDPQKAVDAYKKALEIILRFN